MNEDRCIMCGSYVPEGEFVCYECGHPYITKPGVMYVDPFFEELYGWKIYKKESMYMAFKSFNTVILEAPSFEGIIELILMRENKYKND